MAKARAEAEVADVAKAVEAETKQAAAEKLRAEAAAAAHAKAAESQRIAFWTVGR